MAAVEFKSSAKQAAASNDLALLYLANDLIQRSKIKKQSDFHSKFKPHLPHVFSRLVSEGITAINQQSISKIIDVWANRDVYPKEVLEGLQATLTKKVAAASQEEVVVDDRVLLSDFKATPARGQQV